MPREARDARVELLTGELRGLYKEIKKFDPATDDMYHAIRKRISNVRDQLRYLMETPEKAVAFFIRLGYPCKGGTLQKWKKRDMYWWKPGEPTNTSNLSRGGAARKERAMEQLPPVERNLEIDACIQRVKFQREEREKHERGSVMYGKHNEALRVQRERLRFLAGTPDYAILCFEQTGAPPPAHTIKRWRERKLRWWCWPPRNAAVRMGGEVDEAMRAGEIARAQRAESEAKWQEHYRELDAKQAEAKKRGHGGGHFGDDNENA